jgi:hypothetical protein
MIWHVGVNKQVRMRRKLGACWWLTPIILATWEVEIRRIEVRGQPREIVLEIPISKITKAYGLEV